MVATRTATEDPPPVTVSFRSPIAPAPVPVELAAAQAPLHPPDVTAAQAPMHPPAVPMAPALVAPDAAGADVAEPQVVEWPQLPTQQSPVSDVSDSSDDSLPIQNSQNFRTVSQTPLGIDPMEHRLQTEAIPTDRQPSHYLLRQNLQSINSCGTGF